MPMNGYAKHISIRRYINNGGGTVGTNRRQHVTLDLILAVVPVEKKSYLVWFY
jgi:hypothetical protein